MAEAAEIFICSFCERPIRYRSHQAGRRVRCPNCSRAVLLVSNQVAVVDEQLSSTWFYRKTRLFRGQEDVGPIDDTEFIDLARKEYIDAGTEVMSPELTNGSWAELGRIKLDIVTERINQREAERERRLRVAARRKKADEENRAKLKRGIRSAIETGSISSKHYQAIEKFALSAGIPPEEVESTIASQSRQLVREVFEESLDDGILEPREEEQISALAISLGVELDFNKEDERRIALCRLAYELDSGSFRPTDEGSVPFKMAAREEMLSQASTRWHEVTKLKRPAGIPLGGDNYLKEIGSGMAYLTTKQISMVGELQSKKFTLSSVQRVRRYTDGILFNRSSGKSVFLQMPLNNEVAGRFALIAEHACSGEAVLGHSPSETFIPEVIEAQIIEKPALVPSRLQQTTTDPRYTFRVVGDFVGQRESYIRMLHVGDRVILAREPANEYDPNAVAVYDSSRRQLGYLKRDVASWFAPILARKPDTAAKVHTFTPAGSLIVGVYF